MEVKSLQRQLTEAEKRATERWYMYDAERQNHNITKKDLRMAIDALEYYLDNGDCHNAITRAEEAIKAIVLPQSIWEQAGLSEPPDILSNPTWKQCRLKISEPDWTGSKKSMKARALESMAKIKKPMSHPGTGLEVSMNREARKKTILQAKSTHALMAANILPHIFLNSEYSGHTTDRKERPEIKAFHSFKTNVSFGKNNYTAEITATEYTNEEVLHFKVLHLRPKK